MEIVGKAKDGSSVYKVPAPIQSFTDAPFNPALTQALGKTFEKPSPIQAQSWPIVGEGRDMISVARTGSGKTLGFLLPCFDTIKKLQQIQDVRRERVCSPLVVVLAPTRELAQQIRTEAVKYTAHYRDTVSCVVVYGGESKNFQIRKLQRMVPTLLIATPGRLNDLCDTRCLSLAKTAVLVLDEADRMLDMGFGPQLDAIMQRMPEQKPDERPHGLPNEFSRQTLFFTATWPRSVQRVAADLLVNPVQLNVGDSKQLVANENITQRVVVLEEREKADRLKKELKEIPDGVKVIIFCNTKRMCQETANELYYAGVPCDALHGDKEQRERNRIMEQFKTGRVPMLFATDVAARGLDVKDIQFVINYDFPRPKGAAGIEDFVHRIGRTARAGAKGTAITFFTQDNRRHAGPLVNLLTKAKQEAPEELKAMVQRGGFRSGGQRGYGGGRGRFGRGGYGGGRGRGGFGGRGRGAYSKRW